MADLKQLQDDFLKVQQMQQHLNNEKIRLETELKTITQDYQQQEQELLELTGCKNVADIELLIKDLESEITDLKKQVETQLTQYLETYNNIDLKNTDNN